METTMSVQLGINPLTWTNDDLPSLVPNAAGDLSE